MLEGTSAWDFASRAANLEQHIRLRQGRIAVSGSGGWSGAESSRPVAPRWTWCTGECRRAPGAAARGGAARKAPWSTASLLRARQHAAPRGVEALPFYYRQLFVGQSAISDAFWVAREAELAKGRRALGGARSAGGRRARHRLAAPARARCASASPGSCRSPRRVPRLATRWRLDRPTAFDASLAQATDGGAARARSSASCRGGHAAHR